MQKKYFGTDGIRGTANKFPMTPEIALRFGMAAGAYFHEGTHKHKVIIGKDTRRSGYMVESALVSGFTAMGMDVIQVGPMPTPAIAMLTRSMRADIGVMISASHNPYHDNGIKVFDSNGLKPSDEIERQIEALMDSDLTAKLVDSSKLGRAERLENVRGRYIEYIKTAFPKSKTLENVKVVVDSANGAAYHVAALVFHELGAEVIAMADKPNGYNINENCGSTKPQAMQDMVKQEGADLGIALDGDADRVVLADEKGNLIDGDQLMAVIALHLKEEGVLRGNGIVATVMSNLGLEHYLKDNGLDLHRTQVGDRYVSEYMREKDFNVGGEQSGHIILSDYSTTGDGILAAIQFLAVMVEKSKKASELAHVFEPFPQILKNFRYDPSRNPDELIANAQATIDAAEKALASSGRILIRKSGTEPLIRVMAEGRDEKQIEQTANSIIESLNS
ncbi:MAG: phosphoglucosamine mutase [Alphaproteobacteria bacterium CG11_big_fil_rev_8_21_14_0_20_44_7]|nr:MAG: phosphoglucosamine mutase [Alphaproteobacteria bacterium CG11_big_fil_rev_8_21_14_0_20_44_7]